MTKMTIGTIAKKAGVKVETIRFYERRGLIAQPARPEGSGFRHYPNDVVRRIRFIRRAQNVGFSLSEIDELLSLKANPQTDCADIRARAQAKLEEVESKILSLKRVREALKEMIDACPASGALRVCSILDALDERDPSANEKAPS